MEAIGAGANILSFVVLALNTAKTTYETLSAVKDGPEIVKRVTANVNQLYRILLNLEKSRIAINDHSVLGHLKICCDQLDSASSFIKKLQITPGERRTGKLWKRLRTFLSEKDLEKLSDNLTLDVAILQLRLQNTSSNAIFSLQQSHLQFERTMGGLTNTIQAQTDVHETSLSTLKKEICDTVNEQSDTARTLLNTMYEVISARNTVPKSDGDEMITLLKEIKGLLIKPPIQQQARLAESATKISAPPLSTRSSSSHHSMTDDSCELIQSIDRLCRLISDKGRVVNTFDSDDDGESQSIVKDLQTILQIAYKRGELIEPHETSIGSRRGKIEYFKKVSRRFERAFDQKGILINPEVVNRKHVPHKITRQRYLYQMVRTDIGTITLTFNHRTRSSDTTNPYQHREEKLYSDYSSTFKFFPNDPQRFHMIAASIFQRETELNVRSSISQLAVNRILPWGSRVFQVIKDGDLCELQRMLNDGEASLRDHDEHGASLLFYAMLQPRICQFLVQNGMDVNHVGLIHEVYESEPRNQRINCTALQVPFLTAPDQTEMNTDELIRSQSCCRMLLEAGADPTFQSWFVPYLTLACQSGSVDSILLAFDPKLTGHITSFTSYLDEWNRSPLLLYVSSCEALNMKKEALRTLFDLGADIHSRDEFSNTCLHICFTDHSWSPGADRQDYEAIKFLIEMGADVRAINVDGKTVSDYAYYTDWPSERNIGNYTGDLWDSVLQSCGYNIAEFRTEIHRRQACYTDKYKREDFERLWQGREHLCPYWGDSTWPSWPSLEVFSTDNSDLDSIDSEESDSRHGDREDSNAWDSDSEDRGAPL
ncbi:ankyrin [Annulohypoxylon nitens]|nr:ankyrin [Annulohypoxylon nitens]